MGTPSEPRLGPVMLITHHLDDMTRFYDRLGLRGSHEPTHHTWYHLAGQPFVLHRPDPEPGPEYTPRAKGSLVWLITPEDLGELSRRLREAGSQVWGPYDGDARSVLYTVDPDGNMVGLTTPSGGANAPFR